MKESSNQKIVNKIQALLALATSPNENEAMAAMEKAQALLAQYDLAMADVEGRDEPNEAVTRIQVDCGLRSAPVWQQWILTALAKSNHCLSYTDQGKLKLIGKPHRVQIVSSLFAYLLDTVARERKAALKVAKVDPNSEANRYSNYSWNHWSTDFNKGMAIRIHKRLIEQAERAELQGIAQSSALVIQNQSALAKQENQAFARSIGLRLAPSRQTRSRQTSAYASGQAAGSRAGLNAQMSGGSGRSSLALPGR